ncbi:MAG TPA: methyltransferase domain-containing protein [Nitrososphaerales archaeon]|nr:methyltransferase domain-containing protein [Nitrososphaerales archaeon]
MKRRRPGLQGKWAYVVNSLQVIMPSYEKASSRISLFEDRRLRSEAVSSAVTGGSLVLDLGAGPGTLSRLVAKAGGTPVLLDVSRKMLGASNFELKVQAAFEQLPFRPSTFDSVVAAFAVRDSRDLVAALSQVSAALKDGGHFSFCDLGKPDSELKTVAVAYYLRLAPAVIGMLTAGRVGLRYASIYPTYVLVPHNSVLSAILSRWFEVSIREFQMGASIVVVCTKTDHMTMRK